MSGKKILVISDSHGYFDNIHKMYKKEKPDIVIFAGDGEKDFEDLSYSYDESLFIGVRGNMDADGTFPLRKEVEIEGRKFFIAHGNYYGVKATYDNILAEAKRLLADIVIFGHTHEMLYEVIEGIRFLNPGAARNGNYAVLNLDEKGMKVEHKKI